MEVTMNTQLCQARLSRPSILNVGESDTCHIQTDMSARALVHSLTFSCIHSINSEAHQPEQRHSRRCLLRSVSLQFHELFIREH